MAVSGVPRKKSQVTPPGIDHGTVRLVAQRLNHYATPSPYHVVDIIIIIIIIIASLSPLYRVAIHIFPRQTMSLGIHCYSYSLFVVYGASMSSSCVGSVVLLR